MFTSKTVLACGALSLAVLATPAHATSSDPFVNSAVGARESYPNLTAHNCADILSRSHNYSVTEWNDRNEYCKELRIHNAMSANYSTAERSPSAGGDETYSDRDNSAQTQSYKKTYSKTTRTSTTHY